MKLQESGQMYLETIFFLSEQKQHVRSIDVANYMNFSRASVSRGMQILKDNNYITIDDRGYIFLTDAGKQVAQEIGERHHILTNFLVSIGVSQAIAVDDACRLEHYMSHETFMAIKQFTENNKK